MYWLWAKISKFAFVICACVFLYVHPNLLTKFLASDGVSVMCKNAINTTFNLQHLVLIAYNIHQFESNFRIFMNITVRMDRQIDK